MTEQPTETLQKRARHIHTLSEIEHERAAIAKQGRFHPMHWAVLVLSFLLAIGIWQYSRVQVENRHNVLFEASADRIPFQIEERLQKYELALWAGVSALQLHGVDMPRHEWQKFASNLEIDLRYPGINGIGVIHQVQPDDLPAYLARHRIDRPGFKVHPFAERQVYQPITFIEPVAINAEAVGLDMMHESNRATALAKSRDLGVAQITGPIVLVQDAEGTPGFLFFAPYYAKTYPQSLEARQADFAGAVYAPFIVSNLVNGVLSKDLRDVMIRIKDGEDIIYDELDPADADFDSNTLGQKTIMMDVYGREWTVDVRASQSFRTVNQNYESLAILVLGLLIELALIAVFILLTRANRRGLAFCDMATEALRSESQALSIANHELETARINAENLSNAKSTFLSTMSHEIRTPLTAISGILVLLQRAELAERQEKLVLAGQQASRKLMKLLTDVLDVSRLEAEAVQLWERNVVVAPLVEEWRIIAEGMVERLDKDIAIVATIEPSAPSKIRIDDIRLAQVMNNLMDNAIRFTQVGQITINVSGGQLQSGHGAAIVIAVTDTGPGIPDTDLDLIFARFQQVDGSITRKHGGSGLGLAICDDLVKLMQGNIAVSSEFGVGTTFIVTLPAHGSTARGTEDE